MAQRFSLHPENPQRRLLRRAADIIQSGGVVVYPTDTSYALGCQVGCKDAIDRIKDIRRLKDKHHFTILCRDLSELGNYASVDNSSYRLLKTYLPGPFTFILKATRSVPRRLLHPKRKTIGIRVPENKIIQGLLVEHGAALMTTSLILPADPVPLSDPCEIEDRVGKHVDLILDGGCGSLEVTTLVDLVDGFPDIIRQGVGQL